MKKNTRLFVFSFMLLILTINTDKSFAQEDLPWFMEQHGNNGNQSPQGAPLDGGSDVLFILGIAYGVKKILDMRRKNRISR